MRQRTGHSATLYTPPKKAGRFKKVLISALPLLVLGGVGYLLWDRPTVQGWRQGAVTRVLGFLGHELVTIEVVSTPSRISLFVDGEAIQRLPIEIAKDDKPHTLMAAAAGYVPTTISFRPNRPQRIIVILQPMK